MPKKKNRSFFAISDSKIETREADGSKHVMGNIPYNSASEKIGWFTEYIQPGAFTKTLQEGDIRCLWNHDTQKVCGRNKAQTLEFNDKEDGLHFDCTLPDTTWATDMYESIQRGDTTGVSFGFQVVKDQWTDTQEDDDTTTTRRDLLEVKLFEVSVGVTFPAYPDSISSVATRELAVDDDIDLDIVGRALLSKRTNKPLGDKEKTTLRNSVDKIKSLLPEEESRKEDKPVLDIDATYQERSRNLALLEMETTI